MVPGTGNYTEVKGASACAVDEPSISVKECASTLSAVWLSRSIRARVGGATAEVGACLGLQAAFVFVVCNRQDVPSKGYTKWKPSKMGL